ncbi:MAG TPA: molybdenum cofactor guanylyltransferase [Bryobacteraceae bacterium]|nr:molybdenum cofactor guanylyltransferase [Bryobacteraceae bacterium]
MNRAGYVLVGGRSARMGRDKALLPYRGGALAESVAQAVAQACGSAVLVGAPERYTKLHFPTIADLYPGEGPLGGILTALHHTSANWNLVVACDMPEITAEFLDYLMNAAERLASGILLPASPSGLPQPLCAAYHRNVQAALAAAYARGIRKVTAAFEGIPVTRMTVPEMTPLQNVNTPEDWAGYGTN